MWMRTLALIALAPALAFAKTSITNVSREARASAPDTREDTAMIILGDTGREIAMDKLRVVLAPDDTTRSVRIVLTLSTSAENRRQAVLPLALPRGARISGAAISIGNEARMVASTMSPEDAREEYESVFRVAKDPLLVELADPFRDVHSIANDAFETESDTVQMFQPFVPTPAPATDREGYLNYVVRAFPLTNRDNARVELTIEMPDDAARLAITHAQTIGSVEVQRASTSGPEFRRRRDVRGPIAMDLPPPRVMPVSVAKLVDRAHVDATRSLYAGFAPAVPTRGISSMPIVSIGIPHGPRYWGVDKTIIRRTVKQHMNQLARCYTKVTEYRGGPEGTAVMHFFIQTDGTIANAFVDGEIEDSRITDCLAEQVVQWRFSPGDGGIQVNYPLHFQMAK